MKRVLLYFKALAVLALLFTNSCTKSDQTSSAHKEELALAKEWFNNEMLNQAQNADQNSRPIVPKKLLWQQAKFFEKGGNIIIQVPYQTTKAKTFIFGADKNAKLPLTLQDDRSFRYVVLVNKGKERIMFLMTLLPDKSMAKGEHATFNSYFYGNLNEGFSGTVMYHTWNEGFLRGYKANNGKLSAKINYPEYKRAVRSDNNARTTFCTTTTITEYCQDCTNWTFSNGEYSYEFCGNIYSCDSYSYQVCETVEDDNNPGGGWTEVPEVDAYTPAAKAILCDANVFTVAHIGSNSWTGNAQYVAAGFQYHKAPWTNYVVNFYDLCFTVPRTYTNVLGQQEAVSAATASEIFRKGFNEAVESTTIWLNMYPGVIRTYPEVRTKLMEQLRIKMVAESNTNNPNGFTATDGPCLGNIPRTVAKYGPECEPPI